MFDFKIQRKNKQLRSMARIPLIKNYASWQEKGRGNNKSYPQPRFQPKCHKQLQYKTRGNNISKI